MRYNEFLAARDPRAANASGYIDKLASCARSRSSGDADRSIEDVGEDE